MPASQRRVAAPTVAAPTVAGAHEDTGAAADAAAPAAGQARPVEVGEAAPDFELRDQHNQPVRLSDYRGKRAVTVLFYPMAFSTICDAELCGLRDDLAAFDNDEAALLAVSCDAPSTHRRQAQADGYRFPLLSDFWPHGHVAQRYGIFDARFGVARRATFLIDRDGVVVYRTVRGIGDPRDADELREAIGSLTAGAAEA